MTAQIPDEVTYLGTSYALTAVDGTGLFDLAAHGLQREVMSTACWRGYVCEYEVVEDRLILARVEVGRTGRNRQTSLYGVAPEAVEDEGHHPGQLCYRPAAPVEFTGRLLLGNDYVHVGYLHMGFAPAWLYADVWELIFTQGRLEHAHDRSADLAAVRQRLGPDALRPPGAVTDWIDASFSLSFDYSWPRTPA